MTSGNILEVKIGIILYMATEITEASYDDIVVSII